MSDALLSELSKFVTELENKESSARHEVPDEVLKAVKRAKSLERLLYEIFMQVSGNGGIDLRPIIRREFGITGKLMDHFEQWLPYSKEIFEDDLHDAIDRAEIRAGNQGVFFAGTPSKTESEDVLQLLRDIAHSAVKCQFHAQTGPELYVDILDKLLLFYAMPSTFPEGNASGYRNLIAADRLYAMSGGDDPITEALKASSREWYQKTQQAFLEYKEAYLSYEYVQYTLYVLKEEQLERLRSDYIRYIEQEFKLIKTRPDLIRASHLRSELETVLSWKSQS